MNQKKKVEINMDLACLIKRLPVLRIPAWLYAWIRMITLIKAVIIVSGFAVQRGSWLFIRL